MRKFLASFVLVTTCGTGPLAAQDADLFQQLDTNKDGSVAAAEVPAEHKARFERLLKIAGKSPDQKLGLPLFQAALKQLQTEERAAANPQVPAGQPAIDAAELFAKLDANQDGFVTAAEVPEGQRSLFDRLVRNADGNGDKQLSKAEFQAGLKPDEAPRQPLAGGGLPGRRGGQTPQVNARQQFERMDANRDGKVTKDELPPFMQERFARLDANSDGSLSPEELSRGPMALPGRPPGDLGEQFDRLDANRDGKLTKDEVPEERQFMRRIFERAEVASGLTKDQFLRAMAAAGPPGGPRPDGAPLAQPADALRPALAAIDADLDGELSPEEIANASKALLSLDRNGDGKLTRDEIAGRPR